MIERIKKLCAKYGTNFSAVEKELGFANASLKKTTSAIRADRLYALAKRFDVSMEYLLTGEQTDYLSKNEKEVLSVYRQLPEDAKADAATCLELMAKMPKYSNPTTQNSKAG